MSACVYWRRARAKPSMVRCSEKAFALDGPNPVSLPPVVSLPREGYTYHPDSIKVEVPRYATDTKMVSQRREADEVEVNREEWSSSGCGQKYRHRKFGP